MKNIVILLFLTMNFLAVNSQIVYFGTGKTISKLTFTDTDGNTLKGIKGSNEQTFYLGCRYPLFNSKLNVSADVAYQHYISTGSDPTLGNYYQWDGTFAGINLGFDYEFLKPDYTLFKKQVISFCLKTSIGSEFVVDGTQQLNNQVYDLKSAPEFKNPFYFARGGISVNYYFAKELYAFAQYMGGKSIMLGDNKNKQQVSYTTHCITVGIAYNFAYSKSYKSKN